MDSDSLVRLTVRAMLLCLTVSLPPVVVSALLGLIVSFLQAITSMQDQALPHTVKLIAVIVLLIVVAPLSAATILHFANDALQVALPL
jgi:type III secretion protein S